VLKKLEKFFSIFSKGIDPKDTHYTIPHPKDAAFAEFAALHHLSSEQIQNIIQIVGEQVELSRRFNLFIEWETHQKEVVFVLVFLDHMGGPSTIYNRYSFDDTRSLMTEMMSAHFYWELDRYFAQCSIQGGVKNKYACHLDSLRSALIHKIYNNEL
jgi:hypothetical protein